MGGQPHSAPGSPSGLEVFQDLERWLAEASSQRLGLPVVERESERRGREVVRVALQAHVDGRGDGDVGPAIVADGPDGAALLSHKRMHTRRLVTLFGPITITRIGYGAPGQPSIHPLDAELCLPGRAYSYELCRRLVRAAVCAPFDEAIALVTESTGVVVPKRSAEQIVAEASVDFDTFYAARAAADVGLAAGEILVGAIDCKGIPMVKPAPASKAVRMRKGQKRNKKRMATVGTVFNHPPRVRTPEQVVESLFTTPQESTAPGEAGRRPRHQRPRNKRVWASLLASKDTFIADVRSEMTRRDPNQQHTWVIVTDGERALQKRVGTTFDNVTLVLDLLHVLEKLWTAAYVFHPEGSPQAEAFVRERALRILRGQISQVVKGLRQMVTKRNLKGTKRDTIGKITSYYYNNRARMRYHHYLAHGWPIASGSVEGACKNLINDRMERSGMRWTPTMAEAMLRMRATHLSGDLETYWEHHIQQDQQRLRPQGRWSVVPK